MPTLFSYCIPHDTGAAPNPFWGVCTLVICKPTIRRVARKGDWVVGTGSINSPIGDIRGRVVYAMEVTDVMTMQEYDAFTHQKLPQKIPDRKHSNAKRYVGDSIYDFRKNPPYLRKSVHSLEDRDHDLHGRNALLSRHFFYFGDKPIELPYDLKPIAHQGQGHRSKLNDQYIQRFIQWIHWLGYKPNCLLGKPQQNVLPVIVNCSKKCYCKKE